MAAARKTIKTKKVTTKAIDAPTRDRFLQSALREFCRRGYHGTSVRDISLASGVTKPAFYYYFGSKESLFKQIAGECFKTVFDGVSTRVDGKTALERGLAVLHACCEMRKRYADACNLVYVLMCGPNDDIPDCGAKSFCDRLRELIRREVTEFGLNGQEIQDHKADHVDFALLTSVLWVLSTGLNDHFDHVTTQLTEQSIRALFEN